MELDVPTLWNIIITLVIAPLAYYIKSQSDELKRIQILLNKTREQYVHKNLNTSVNTTKPLSPLYHLL